MGLHHNATTFPPFFSSSDDDDDDHQVSRILEGAIVVISLALLTVVGGILFHSRCCGYYRRRRDDPQLDTTPQQLEHYRQQRVLKIKARQDFVQKILPNNYCCASNETECTICLSELVVGDAMGSATTGSCPHVFHRECIADWLLRQRKCPICRQIFLWQDEEALKGDNSIADVEQGVREVTVDAETVVDDEEEENLERIELE